jgi:hypothetical protein
MKKIAIVSALGIGDGLLSMVIANNLQLNGYATTTFNNHLVQLQDWFPNLEIKAFPNELDIFNKYDQIISTDGAPLFKMQHSMKHKYHVFFEREFDRNKTVLLNFLDICQQFFQVKKVSSDNGLQPPANLGLNFRQQHKRVIIHPMSTSRRKNWLPQKFLQLAIQLEKKKFQPIFVVSPVERPEWEIILKNNFPLPLFPSLDNLAAFIYESGFMIGNDSGIGHLAANLQIPTLSLFARGSVANLWRPGWGRGDFVVPTWQLPGARLRGRYWQYFLTVRKVLKRFLELQ